MIRQNKTRRLSLPLKFPAVDMLPRYFRHSRRLYIKKKHLFIHVLNPIFCSSLAHYHYTWRMSSANNGGNKSALNFLLPTCPRLHKGSGYIRTNVLYRLRFNYDKISGQWKNTLKFKIEKKYIHQSKSRVKNYYNIFNLKSERESPPKQLNNCTLHFGTKEVRNETKNRSTNLSFTA